MVITVMNACYDCFYAIELRRMCRLSAGRARLRGSQHKMAAYMPTDVMRNHRPSELIINYQILVYTPFSSYCVKSDL